MRIATVLIACLLALTACNTIEGMGEDVEGAGEVIQDGAQKTKKAMTN